jgi:hypothetical protein
MRARLAGRAARVTWVGLPAMLFGVAVLSPARLEAQAGSEARSTYSPPRTPWGDPDLQGAYTNSDESLIPMERPESLSGKTLDAISDAELAKLVEQRNLDREEADRQRWELRSPLHWFENHNPKNSRAWMVSDPPDGKIPAQIPEARARAAARAAVRKGRGEADSWEDRSMFDRCISRSVPGSMMPAIYGNAYQIQQGPGYVAILYEMIHEARVIPLGEGPQAGSPIRSYMGEARGRFEGNTLVVETRGFNDRVPYRGSSRDLVLTERFTPVGPKTVEWSVTFNDPATWVRPWTFGMHLTQVPDAEGPFEYACHEGNYAMFNLLAAAREEEKAAAGAKPAGGTKPAPAPQGR